MPQDLPWQEADLDIQHPRVAVGGVGRDTRHKANSPPTTCRPRLLLPMGRFGPAFLAYPNFKAFLGWNAAMVYSTTVAYYASAPGRRAGGHRAAAKSRC